MKSNPHNNKNIQIIKRNMTMENKKRLLNNNNFGLINLNLKIKM